MADAPTTLRKAWAPRAIVMGSLAALAALALVVVLVGWARDTIGIPAG